MDIYTQQLKALADLRQELDSMCVPTTLHDDQYDASGLRDIVLTAFYRDLQCEVRVFPGHGQAYDVRDEDHDLIVRAPAVRVVTHGIAWFLWGARPSAGPRTVVGEVVRV